jgi:hypothetical protein
MATEPIKKSAKLHNPQAVPRSGETFGPQRRDLTVGLGADYYYYVERRFGTSAIRVGNQLKKLRKNELYCGHSLYPNCEFYVLFIPRISSNRCLIVKCGSPNLNLRGGKIPENIRRVISGILFNILLLLLLLLLLLPLLSSSLSTVSSSSACSSWLFSSTSSWMLLGF